MRACALFPSIISNLRAPCDTSALVYKDIFQAPPCDSAAVYIPGAFPPPKPDICRCALLGAPRPIPKLRHPPHTHLTPPPLTAGHVSAGRNSQAVGLVTAVFLLQSVSRGHAGALEQSHAQHSAGMPRSTASFLTGTTVLFLVEKDAPRGSELSGGETHLMEGTGATSGL